MFDDEIGKINHYEHRIETTSVLYRKTYPVPDRHKEAIAAV